MAAGRRYDENLLSLAPPATKAEPHAQDYDVGLLKRPPPNSQPPPVVGHALHAKENYLPPPQQPPPPPVPFWKSKTGIISIVAAIVCLAVVIGAAVGATRHPRKALQMTNGTQNTSYPGVVSGNGTTASTSNFSSPATPGTPAVPTPAVPTSPVPTPAVPTSPVPGTPVVPATSSSTHA